MHIWVEMRKLYLGDGKPFAYSEKVRFADGEQLLSYLRGQTKNRDMLVTIVGVVDAEEEVA
jgi:hypothetical protein